MVSLFISDLHLCKERPEITELFLGFLENRARGADALYILGDLFEVWIGDDAIGPENRRIISAIREVADHGVSVAFMHGNRDFLIGDTFAAMCGCRLLTDPTIIELNGEPTLLMHGDTLCTDDTEYQQFRASVRDPEFQRDFLSQPAAKRSDIADHYRKESRERSKHKPLEIMDVNQEAVISVMEHHHVKRLIHGHTHRPAIHTLKVNGQEAQRIVLGDWYHQGSVLMLDNNGYRLEAFDKSNTLSVTTG
jgi:UDP-2,3-diacylglucosamine hydrolase